MKKLALSVVVAALALVAGQVSAQEWKEVKLLEKASVKMGGTPQDETNGGMTGKKAYLEDSTGLGALLINFADFGLSEDALAAMAESEQFEEQYKTGVTANGGEIVASSKGKVSDKYPYLEYDVKMTKDGKDVITSMRSIFYKGYAVALVYTPGKNGKDDAVKKKYFDSVVLAD